MSRPAVNAPLKGEELRRWEEEAREMLEWMGMINMRPETQQKIEAAFTEREKLRADLDEALGLLLASHVASGTATEVAALDCAEIFLRKHGRIE